MIHNYLQFIKEGKIEDIVNKTANVLLDDVINIIEDSTKIHIGISFGILLLLEHSFPAMLSDILDDERGKKLYQKVYRIVGEISKNNNGVFTANVSRDQMDEFFTYVVENCSWEAGYFIIMLYEKHSPDFFNVPTRFGDYRKYKESIKKKMKED